MADPQIVAGRRRHVFDSFYSIITLVFILIACVELCDASTVVDVYRLIQYDISGAPFGSRAASINHHAGSSFSPPGSDLSRTVAVLTLRELNETFVRGNC
ncbi:putative nicalin [Helianthus annuus]|nr:putative nicalin [Helianthus annuus]